MFRRHLVVYRSRSVPCNNTRPLLIASMNGLCPFYKVYQSSKMSEVKHFTSGSRGHRPKPFSNRNSGGKIPLAGQSSTTKRNLSYTLPERSTRKLVGITPSASRPRCSHSLRHTCLRFHLGKRSSKQEPQQSELGTVRVQPANQPK
ncbi:unnamed protein product, partial [Ectocarpus sp. 12 AP-2014]